MKEKKIKISVNEEDVQNLINCYEKDIEYIKKLEKENEILKIEIRDLKEQLKDENTYHEEANKWCIEAQKLSIRINKAIEYIKQCEEYEDCCNGDEIIWILKGED